VDLFAFLSGPMLLYSNAINNWYTYASLYSSFSSLPLPPYASVNGQAPTMLQQVTGVEPLSQQTPNLPNGLSMEVNGYQYVYWYPYYAHVSYASTRVPTGLSSEQYIYQTICTNITLAYGRGSQAQLAINTTICPLVYSDGYTYLLNGICIRSSLPGAGYTTQTDSPGCYWPTSSVFANIDEFSTSQAAWTALQPGADGTTMFSYSQIGWGTSYVDLSTVPVAIRSHADPYITALTATQGSLDFSPGSGITSRLFMFAFGIVFGVAALGLLILTLVWARRNPRGLCGQGGYSSSGSYARFSAGATMGAGGGGYMPLSHAATVVGPGMVVLQPQHAMLHPHAHMQPGSSVGQQTYQGGFYPPPAAIAVAAAPGGASYGALAGPGGYQQVAGMGGGGYAAPALAGAGGAAGSAADRYGGGSGGGAAYQKSAKELALEEDEDDPSALPPHGGAASAPPPAMRASAPGGARPAGLLQGAGGDAAAAAGAGGNADPLYL
jgi:hypothetical protein